jgi:hypothetical protein
MFGTCYACLSPQELLALESEIAPISLLDPIAAFALVPIFEQIDEKRGDYATIFFNEELVDLIVAFTDWRPGGGWHNR